MTQSHYKHLRDRWRARHEGLTRKLWNKHRESLDWLSNNYRQLVAGSLGGLMLLTGHGSNPSVSSPYANASEPAVQKIDKKVFLVSDLAKILPSMVRVLTNEEEQRISDILSRAFGLKVAAELGGKRLNRSYGLIGSEQHLVRYPGDTLNTHFDSDKERKSYWQSGMAPGFGAWRYFASSKEALTQLDKDRDCLLYTSPSPRD